ncbi:MAG: hypothetical protein HYS13_24600 [Planctomycetia bacterium]|nr:hypothetical protein [Planctomycetia bacterium]
MELTQNSRKAARLLQADVIHSVASGDFERAVQANDEMFQLADRLSGGPFYITQLTRMAILGMAIHAPKMILAHGDLNAEQFQRLDQRLQAIDKNFRLAPSVLGERAGAMTILEHWKENRPDVMSPSTDSPQYDWWARFPPKRMQAQADMLRLVSEEAAVIDATGRAGQAAFDRAASVIHSDSPQIAALVGATDAVRAAGLKLRQQATNARLAMRVDRFRAQHGRLPASLSEILDDEFPEVSRDLYGGSPVVYKARASGFVIYSLGHDGIDGDAARTVDLQEWGTAIEIVYPVSP